MIKMEKKIIIYILLLLAAILLAYALVIRLYDSQATSENAGKLPVATSFYPLYFFASRIGGDKAAIFNVTPAGAEPHDYEPTARDLARIESSRLVILNGDGLEAWGQNIQANLNPQKTEVIIASQGLLTENLKSGGQETVDPHLWLSPPLAQKMIDNILRGFNAVDSKNKDYYTANAAALRLELEALDKAYRTGLDRCASRDIITSHAAFGYLAASYNLRQIAIAGLSPDTEPSPQELADISRFAKDNNIKYIFFESLVSPKLAQTIASEAGAETLVLNPLEGLSASSLAQGQDYLSEMRNNLTNLRLALTCQ